MNNLFGIGILFELRDNIGNRLRGISRSLEETETQAEQTAHSINSLQNVLQEGSSFQLTARETQRLSSLLEGTSREAESFNRRMQHMAHYLGGEVSESTKQAYATMQVLRREVSLTSRQYGSYSQETMDARNRLTEFALALNDTAFKQIYMRGQLGLTTQQLQQQANGIRLNARMTKLMGNQIAIMNQRMEGLQKLGIKPEMMMPPSTPGQFDLLNDSMKHNVSTLNTLSLGYRNLGQKMEKVIKNYSAQKVAIREANGDMVRYGSILRGITTGLANFNIAIMGLATASALFYGGMFKLAIDHRKSLEELCTTIKGKVLKAMEPLIHVAAKFLEVTLKTIGALADWVNKFNQAHPILANILSVITFLAPAMTMLLLPLALGVGLWKGWMLVLNQVWTLFGGVVALVGTASSTFLVLATVIGVLVGAFIHLWNTNKDFKENMIKAWETIKTTVTDALEYIKQSFTKNFTPVLETGKKVVQSFSEVFKTTFGIIKDIVNITWESISSVFGIKGKETGDILKNAFDVSISFIAQKLDMFLMKVKMVLDNVNRFLTKHREEIVNTFKGVVEPTIKFIEQVWTNANTVISLALQTMGSIVTGVLDNLRVFWNKHGYEVSNTVSSIVATVQEFSSKIQEFIGTALDIISSWWKEHGTEVMSTVTQMITTVGNIFNRLASVVSTIFGGIVSFLSKHGETIKTILTVAWTVISTVILDTLNSILGFIEGVISTIQGIIKVFSSVLQGDFKGMWEGIKQTFTGALQAIYNGVMVYLNVGLLKSVKGLAKGFTGAIKSMWSGIKSLFSEGVTRCYVFADDLVKGIVKRLQGMPQTLAKVFDDIVKFIANGLKTGFDNAIALCSNFVTGIKNFFIKLVTDLPTMMSNLWSSIVGAVNNGISFCLSYISTFVSNVLAFFSSLLSMAQQIWSIGLNYIRTLVSGFVSNIIAFFSNFRSNITNIFTTLLNTGKNIFTNLVNAIKNTVSKIPSAIKTPVQNAISYLKGISLVQIGKDMIQGLANGIKSMASTVVNSVKGVVDGAVKKAKSLLKINSPSKLFRQFGAWTSEGLAIGITREAPKVVDSMDNMTRSTIDVAEVNMKQTPNFLTSLGKSSTDTPKVQPKEVAPNTNSTFNYNITINADNNNLGNDPKKFANEIYKEIKRLQQLEDSMKYKPTNLVF